MHTVRGRKARAYHALRDSFPKRGILILRSRNDALKQKRQTSEPVATYCIGCLRSLTFGLCAHHFLRSTFQHRPLIFSATSVDSGIRITKLSDNSANAVPRPT